MDKLVDSFAILLRCLDKFTHLDSYLGSANSIVTWIPAGWEPFRIKTQTSRQEEIDQLNPWCQDPAGCFELSERTT